MEKRDAVAPGTGAVEAAAEPSGTAMRDALGVVASADPGFLVELAARNELEVPSAGALAAVLASWRLAQGEATRGGVCVYLRDGEYVLDLFAVDRAFRGRGLSHALYDAAIAFVRSQGAARVFVVTKVPAYFAAKGFREIPRGDAPDFSECFACALYGERCFPSVMVLEL